MSPKWTKWLRMPAAWYRFVGHNKYILALLLAGSGCGPEVEQQGFGPIEIPVSRERVRPNSRQVTLGVRIEPEKLVRETLDKESGLTYEAWIDKMVEESLVQIIFPRWQTIRLAPQKYEVRFTYNQIFQNNRIVPSGFAWKVDLRMGLVNLPRTLKDEDFDPASRFRNPYDAGRAEESSTNP